MLKRFHLADFQLHDLEIRVGNNDVAQRNPLCAWYPGTVGQLMQFLIRHIFNTLIFTNKTSCTILIFIKKESV